MKDNSRSVAIEDHALERVPDSERKGWPGRRSWEAGAMRCVYGLTLNVCAPITFPWKR